jgi:acyltransferase
LEILIGALLFYVAGYWLNLELDIVNLMKRRLVGYNYLFIHEAITMYAFYLLGIYLRRKQFLMGKMSPKIVIPSVIIMFLIVMFTYNLNNGPFNFNYYNSLDMSSKFLLVPITAVGSFFILFLAKITPSQKTIVWMGQNTLILMCLNGIFYHYINFKVAKWIVTNLSGSFLTILGVGCVMTVASLTVCIPLIYLFNKFVPQLVGKPKIKGPWLRNLI